ncbi:MAG: serine/threonine protein kinase [Myxococcales bacterium]|nr:serine/threonine protein kinase [Myxococcales bacterium]
MIGETLGAYRVERELGRGGMGAVYAAAHTLLGRRAAIKVLLAELSKNEQIVQRFFNEARAASAIKHPSIVEIYDFGWADDGRAYIVMELMDGEPLASRLRRVGRLPVATALHLGRQIANALAAAHATGIVHRDLKPDNVFLVPDVEVAGGERVKLLDFGIAKLTGGLGGDIARTRTGTVMGTPTYMSPEQCEGSREVDHRTDLYALGCMVFEMVSGRPPFHDGGAGAIIAAHIMTPPPALRAVAPDAPVEVEALVARLLAKAPAERVASAAELAAELGRLGAGSLPGSGPGPAAGTSGPPAAGAAPPAARATPTTLAGAAHEVTPALAAPHRSRARLAVGITAGPAVVAALALGAAIVLGEERIHRPRVDAGAVDAGAPDAADLDPRLAPARAALAARRWHDARDLAEDVLADEPDHAEARAVVAAAERGLRADRALDALAAAIAARDWAEVREAHAEVVVHTDPGDPVRIEADALLDRARPDALADARAGVAADVAAGRCDLARRRAADARVAWGEDAAPLAALAATCGR